MPTRESSSSVSLNASRILGTVGTQPKQQWHGIYLASCVQNNDPLGEGRIKMFVPQVLGDAVSNWARPLGYKPSDIPPVGTMVHAYFAGGDVNHPIWVRTDFTSDFNAIQNQINNIGPGAWQSLSLQAGWSNSGGMIPAQVRVVSTGVAQIVGHIQGGTPTDNTLIATLPTGTFSSSGSQVVPVTITAGNNNNIYTGLSVGIETDVSGLADGTVNGNSGTDGLPNGGINGTSASASGSGSHSHGAGSYSVINGQHFHDSGSFAVANGTHQHGTSNIEVETLVNQNNPVL